MSREEFNAFYAVVEPATYIGCYLWPHVLLDDPDYEDPYSATKVAWTVHTLNTEVLVTVNGGLFCRIPDGLDQPLGDPDGMKALWAKIEFERQCAAEFNMVICELATRGIVSEPASPVYIGPARHIDGHLLVTSGSGGRESYFDRSMGWSTRLLQGNLIGVTPKRGMNESEVLDRARAISDLAPDAPGLVASAYSSMSRGQLAEVVAIAWIVIEQYIDRLWNAHRENAVTPPGRGTLLKDTRTYTAAVRTEVLHVTGAIDDDERAMLDRVRKHRNDLAHRAEVDRRRAEETAGALQHVLSRVCGEDVAPLLDSLGVGW